VAWPAAGLDIRLRCSNTLTHFQTGAAAVLLHRLSFFLYGALRIMARTQTSAVLSSADKKALVVTLKTDIKLTKDGLKQLAAERKAADKTFDAASKAHVAALKANDKAVAMISKTLATQTAKLDTLSPAPVAA